jgi:hypothetical protein
MIIALLALACAMIVGGLLAAFFGWEIVLVERGWTMVIAGTISAASGALLLGIAAAVSKLSQIAAQLPHLQGSFRDEGVAAAPGISGDLPLAALPGALSAGQAGDADEAERPDEAQPTLPLFEDEDRRELDDGAVKPAQWPEESRADELVSPSFPPRTIPAPASFAEEDETEMKVPDFLLADRGRDAEEGSQVTDGDINIYDRGMDEPALEPRDLDRFDERPEPPAETASEREQGAEPERETAAMQSERETGEAGSDEAHPATVVGTYNSGDNRYVMFSDGSIEAQTPSGVFHFQSLDELKEFIAAGGEGSGTAST